jgi:hypothetical protein
MHTGLDEDNASVRTYTINVRSQDAQITKSTKTEVLNKYENEDIKGTFENSTAFN